MKGEGEVGGVRALLRRLWPQKVRTRLTLIYAALFFATEGRVCQDDIHPEPVPNFRIVKYHPLACTWPAIARVQRHAQTFG